MRFRQRGRDGALLFADMLSFDLIFHYLKDGTLTQGNIITALISATTYWFVWTFLGPLIHEWFRPSTKDARDDTEEKL